MKYEPLTPELQKILEENGYYHITEKKDRGVCALKRMVFTVGLCYGLDESGYAGRFCFEYGWDATIAIDEWDGGETAPPGNWIKYKGEGGEYRNPNYEQ